MKVYNSANFELNIKQYYVMKDAAYIVKGKCLIN